MLEIFDTGFDTAEANMRLDQKLLDQLKSNGRPILHLYKWLRPSATFGYFIQPEKHLDLNACKKYNLDLARRSTGGGIVFHIWDLAFSFLMPSSHPRFSENTLENYHFVNGVVQEVVEEFFEQPAMLIPQCAPSMGPDCQNFCMAKPTQYDVIHNGMKVAGAAQRKKKQGYLHQGTIALAKPNFDLLNEVLLSKEDVLAAMKNYSFAPLEQVDETTRSEVQKLLADKLTQALKS